MAGNQKSRIHEHRVFCAYCGKRANLVTGAELYPHRGDLSTKYFWRCIPCQAQVGCHAGGTGTIPLGRLANAELRAGKRKAHVAIDLHWQEGGWTRSAVYARLAELMKLSAEQTHIGLFDLGQCAVAERLGLTGQYWE